MQPAAFDSLGSLRRYDGCCIENVTLKWIFPLDSTFCDYSMLVKLYKIGKVYFRLFYSNSFHVKAKDERFTAAGSHCTKISSRHLADYFNKLHQKAWRTCCTIVFLNSFNQIIDLWCCRSRSSHRFLNSLIMYSETFALYFRPHRRAVDSLSAQPKGISHP